MTVMERLDQLEHELIEIEIMPIEHEYQDIDLYNDVNGEIESLWEDIERRDISLYDEFIDEEDKMELERIGEVEFGDLKLSVFDDGNEPLFMLKEVANKIGYSTNNRKQLLTFVGDSQKVQLSSKWLSQSDTAVGDDNQIMIGDRFRNQWFVTEGGLSELLMRSTKTIGRKWRNVVNFQLKQLRTSKGFDIFESFSEQNSILEKEDFTMDEIKKELREVEVKDVELEEFVVEDDVDKFVVYEDIAPEYQEIKAYEPDPDATSTKVVGVIAIAAVVGIVGFGVVKIVKAFVKGKKEENTELEEVPGEVLEEIIVEEV